MTTSAVRAAFGVIWAVDAYLTWQPAFAVHYVGYLQNAGHGQPTWLTPWFGFWLALVTPRPGLFIWLTRLLETLSAVGLVLGVTRRWVYVVGAGFSALIWATADGFGGPYTVGAANLGPALIYVLVFVTFIALDRALGRTPYSLDYYLARRWPAWTYLAEWGAPHALTKTPPRVSWPAQVGALVGLGILFAFFLATLESALGSAPATPANAAAAVSPLALAATSSAAPTPARDARLPALLGTGDVVEVTLKATDDTVEIAKGVSYRAWTFGGTVPGPILHVRQWQRVDVTFVNEGHLLHSIDFHAAEVAPDVAYKSIVPGQSLRFSFVARTPGAFLYHCGTPPVLQHIANGMYGAIVVDPSRPLPVADVSYVLVQGEWYTQQMDGPLMAESFDKMTPRRPDEIVFNGRAFQYLDHALVARAGKRIRLYVIDAGPSLPSAFHVIGAVFETVYPDGDPAHALTGVSTYPSHQAPGSSWTW